MADPAHLVQIQNGAKAWNEWRYLLPELIPDLSKADLGGADLREISGINLRSAKLRKANLTRVVLVNADLRQSNLDESDLTDASLGSANLRGASLIGADATGADFSYANLGYADAKEANLSYANLTATRLKKADLYKTNFTKANLSKANLSNASLFNAFLIGADLTGVDLTGTDLTRANLTGADLSGAMCHETKFGGTNLTAVVGLDSIHHEGPSTIDHRTLATLTTADLLPLTFLRGCGLPDGFIEYLPSILNQPLQFHSCFISYSTRDQAFADKLYADLQNEGVRCWFAPHDIQGGRKLYEQIDQAIRIYDRLLLILSPSSMNSEWVKTEIATALERETREERRMLFPVRLVDYEELKTWRCFDADRGKDSAREIREYYIPDFSTWNDSAKYQGEFGNLLRALRSKVGT